jgi:CBS domain containing-hemolysin-like protein
LDPSDAISIIVLIVLIVLSGFFSSSETAVTSVNKIKIRALAKEGDKRAETVQELLDKPRKFLNMVLIMNNIVNISATALLTSLVTRRFGGDGTAVTIATAIMTVVIIIFGEILPKTMANMDSENMALRYAKLLKGLVTFLTPLIAVMNAVTSVILRLLGKKPDLDDSQITEDELRTYVEVSHEEGVIENDEKQMIDNVVDFGDSIAKDVMVPRLDMSTVSDDVSYEELLNAFSEDKFSRLPVYHENIDNIIGIIYLKDIAFFRGEDKTFNMKKYLRPAHFTYEFKKTSELMREMRRASVSMCVVLDEYGTVSGLITLEDLLEEIVGEIRDEYDTDEVDDIIKLNDYEYMVEGGTKLEDFNEVFGTDYNSEDYDSIAGQVIDLFEHIPSKGEMVKDGNLTFAVAAVEHRRIEKIRVRVEPEKETAPEADPE